MRTRSWVLVGVGVGVGIFLLGVWGIYALLPEGMTEPEVVRAQRAAERARVEAQTRQAVAATEGLPDPTEAPAKEEDRHDDSPPSMHLDVLVQDAFSRPVSGATVLIDDDPVGVTRRDGHLRVDRPWPSSRATVWAELGDRRARPSYVRALPEKDGVAHASLTLLGIGATVEGRVVDRAGRPVADARVFLFPGFAPVNTHSDTDGGFVLEGVPAGDYAVKASKGRWGGRVDLRIPPRGSEDQRVWVEVVLDVDLYPTIVTVVDEGDHPIEGARVALKYEGSFVRLTRTDAKGQASVRCASGTDEVTIIATKDGMAFKEVQVGPRPRRLTIRLEPEAVLAVRVRENDGSPRPDTLVALYLKTATIFEDEEKPFSVESTDAEGSARFDNLPPGRFVVKVRQGGEVLVEREVEVFSGRKAHLDLVVRPGEETLAGTVVEAGDGRTIAGASVSVIAGHGETARTWQSETDPGGAFSVEGLWPGTVRLEIEREGYRKVVRSVALPAKEKVRVELDRGCVVTGRLKIDPSLLPIDLRVTGKRSHDVSLHEGGAFEVEVSSETSAVTIEVDPWLKTERKLDQGCSGRVDLGTIEVGAPREIEVEVRAPDASAVAAARIFGHRSGDTALGMTGPDGKARVVLSESEDCLYATHRAWLPSSRQACPNVDARGRAVLTLEAGGWISGQVFASRLGEGNVLIAQPLGKGRGSSKKEVVLDSTGSFRLGPVPPGRYELLLMAEGGAPDRDAAKIDGHIGKMVQVQAGKTTWVELGTPAGAVLSGTIDTSPEHTVAAILVAGAGMADVFQREGFDAVIAALREGPEVLTTYLEGTRFGLVALQNGRGRFALDEVHPGANLVMVFFYFDGRPLELAGMPWMDVVWLDPGERQRLDVVY